MWVIRIAPLCSESGELVHTGRLYPPIDKPPYLVTLYGPAFYVFLAVPYRLAEAAGVSPQVPVRLCILGVFCLCLAVIFLIGKRLYGSTQIAGLGVLFAASLLPVASWTTQVRCDFLGVFFALLSVYVFLLKDGWPGLAAAAVCAGVALLVKQTFIAIPVAMAGWLIYRRRYRRVCLLGRRRRTDRGRRLCHRVVARANPVAAHCRYPSPDFEFREALNTIGTAVSQPAIPFCVVAGLLILWKGPPERLLFLITAFCLGCCGSHCSASRRRDQLLLGATDGLRGAGGSRIKRTPTEAQVHSARCRRDTRRAASGLVLSAAA